MIVFTATYGQFITSFLMVYKSVGPWKNWKNFWLFFFVTVILEICRKTRGRISVKSCAQLVNSNLIPSFWVKLMISLKLNLIYPESSPGSTFEKWVALENCHCKLKNIDLSVKLHSCLSYKPIELLHLFWFRSFSFLKPTKKRACSRTFSSCLFHQAYAF